MSDSKTPRADALRAMREAEYDKPRKVKAPVKVKKKPSAKKDGRSARI